MKKLILLFLITGGIFAQSGQDTISTESGLRYVVLKHGNGRQVIEGNEVYAHYVGKFLDGKVFDSSYERNQPINFILGSGAVIRGWEEGLKLMKVGDKFRFIIPPELAYGEKGAGGVIPPNATLVFDVEVVEQRDPRISTADAMEYVFKQSGIDSAIAKYHELKKNFPDVFDFREKELVKLGKKMTKLNKYEFAKSVLMLNLESYPKSVSTYESLVELMRVWNKPVEERKYLKKLIRLKPGINIIKLNHLLIENSKKGK